MGCVISLAQSCFSFQGFYCEQNIVSTNRNGVAVLAQHRLDTSLDDDGDDDDDDGDDDDDDGDDDGDDDDDDGDDDDDDGDDDDGDGDDDDNDEATSK
ncbi:hypothetical protein PoB_004473300 [Plakobranchus ocellatus]|uniref:Uncharacterized protein n=1 Tax=Plakobranchus ocellatus TaxID=259542 RepID=A0AAV4BGE6_9GAST|nr:hypothetical protein PoB_004473300 [Plakobranchus ocellatus]